MTRTWIAVPAAGVACAGIALAVRTPGEAIAIGVAGAAIAAAVRAFAGATAAGAASAGIAALLGALALLEVPHELLRAAISCAAAAFAIAELVRPAPPGSSPWPAIGAALVAGVLDPSFAVLVAVTGMKMMRSPQAVSRYAPVVPAIGVAGVVLALVAGARWPRLWRLWTGHAPHVPDPLHAALLHGDALGPIAAVAAVAGLVIAATRGRYAAASVLGVAACAAVVAVRTDALAPAALMILAVSAGVAIARLAAMVRFPAAQVVVGATAGVLAAATPAIYALGALGSLSM